MKRSRELCTVLVLFGLAGTTHAQAVFGPSGPIGVPPVVVAPPVFDGGIAPLPELPALPPLDLGTVPELPALAPADLGVSQDVPSSGDGTASQDSYAAPTAVSPPPPQDEYSAPPLAPWDDDDDRDGGPGGSSRGASRSKAPAGQQDAAQTGLANRIQDFWSTSPWGRRLLIGLGVLIVVGGLASRK